MKTFTSCSNYDCHLQHAQYLTNDEKNVLCFKCDDFIYDNDFIRRF